jgi:hypothetical protein
MEGTRPFGASPTQPYKCSQYFKIKVKVNVFISALANLFISAKPKQARC